MIMTLGFFTPGKHRKTILEYLHWNRYSITGPEFLKNDDIQNTLVSFQWRQHSSR